MNPKLLEKLVTLDPDLRAIIGKERDANISISLDANGTTYSVSVNDGVGGSESYSKRIPIAKAKG